MYLYLISFCVRVCVLCAQNVMSDLDNYCNIQTVENINQCGPYLLWQDINNVFIPEPNPDPYLKHKP